MDEQRLTEGIKNRREAIDDMSKEGREVKGKKEEGEVILVISNEVREKYFGHREITERRKEV